MFQLKVPQNLANLINLTQEFVSYRGKKELYEYLVSKVEAVSVNSGMLKLVVRLRRLTSYYWFTVFMPRFEFSAIFQSKLVLALLV